MEEGMGEEWKGNKAVCVKLEARPPEDEQGEGVWVTMRHGCAQYAGEEWVALFGWGGGCVGREKACGCWSIVEEGWWERWCWMSELERAVREVR